MSRRATSASSRRESIRWPPPGGASGTAPGSGRSGRSRNGVGPGADGEVVDAGQLGREPGRGDPLDQPPEPQHEPGGVGRARQAHRPPPHHGHAQARGERQVPVVAVAAEVEHAAHLAARDPAPAGDRLGEVVLVPRAREEHEPHLAGAAGVGVERVDRAARIAGEGGGTDEVPVGDDVRGRAGGGHGPSVRTHMSRDDGLTVTSAVTRPRRLAGDD